VTQFSDDRNAELRELFFETAQELLQSMNEEALKLEQKPGDAETVRTMRRIVHTLKGDSAAAGFQELSEVAHELEDALALETSTAHGSLAEIAFGAADFFGGMLTSYRSQSQLPDGTSLRKKIRELTHDPTTKKAHSRKSKPTAKHQTVWTEYERLAMQAAANDGKNICHILAQVDPHCAMPIAARELLLKGVTELGEILASRPEAGSAENSKSVELILACNASDAEIAAKCKIPTIIVNAAVDRIEIQPQGVAAKPEASSSAEYENHEAQVVADPPVATAAAAQPGTQQKPMPSSDHILRVDAERVDAVLNLVGELIVGKSMLQQALNEFTKHYPKDALRGRFADAMAFQSRVLNDLQRSVMKVRMVPVEQLFRRFPRVVRDVAKQCGKDVQLVVLGQDTDLDKGLLDAIAEPLTHLVRNAVSHGIEDAPERVRAGKAPQGTVRLDAYHQGNQVVVEVSDDGRGIDSAKVKARAVERGLVTQEKAKSLTETEVLEFIFQPGFSTAETITEVSGRGVGLDVVQTVLQRLKGNVQVESRPGQGTKFRLQLPLTLAIIKALLFRVEQRLYAVPLNTVGEIARADEHDLHRVNGCEMLQLREQVLPVIRLGALPPTISERHGKIFVLVIELGEGKFGLLVNVLEGEEELVIKALDDQTVETDLVSGASILGDGRVVLILNLPAVMGRFTKLRHDTEAAAVFGLLLSQSERARSVKAAQGAQA